MSIERFVESYFAEDNQSVRRHIHVNIFLQEKKVPFHFTCQYNQMETNREELVDLITKRYKR